MFDVAIEKFLMTKYIIIVITQIMYVYSMTCDFVAIIIEMKSVAFFYSYVDIFDNILFIGVK